MSSEVDVVVAGAGAAGCSAALAAAETGASVVVVEGNAHFRQGCNTAMSTSMIPAAGSRWQERAGIEDSPRRFHEDIGRKTGGLADEVLARALTAVAPELVAWLADRAGVPLELVTDFNYPGHSRHRCHAVPDRSGASLLGDLVGAVEGSDAVTVVVPMELTGVSLGAAGAVAEALVRRPDGNAETIPTRNVVLATNGYAANRELVERFIPEIAGATYHGSEWSRGDALRIGWELGADTAYLDSYQGHGSLAVPHRILMTWAAVMHGGYLVNARGRRFGDESVGYSEYAAATLAQPGGVAWCVFDDRIDALLRAFEDYRNLLGAGAIRRAAEVVALAEIVGCNEQDIRGTVEAAAAAARGDAADPFGRTRWSAPLEPPFGVVKVTGALFHTQGGLRVDGDGRVLRDGDPIVGLYAAGGAAHSISGHGAGGYLAGNGLLPALGLGYLAGRHAGGRE